jgi:uncharacterized membrane protein YoaK (UPF0700 family)
VYTTHVTGTLTKLSEDLVEWLFWVRDQGSTSGSRDQKCFQDLLLQSGLWIGFTAGAVLGVLGERWAGLSSLAAPTVLLGVLSLTINQKGPAGSEAL